MNSATITEILKNIKETEKKEAAYAIIRNCKPIRITQKNFRQIKECKNAKITYIDGGNAEIINSSELSLQIIQTAAVTKEGKKTVKKTKTMFYTLTQAEEKEGKIIFSTKIFPVTGDAIPEEKALCIDSMDETVTEGKNRASINCIGRIARKFSEWLMCRQTAETLEEGDIIVRDGNLEVDYTNEVKYAYDTIKTLKDKKITLAGVAKTSKVFCDNGKNVTNELDDISKEDSWYYYPLAENCNTLFAKLNKKSKHVFRIDFECYEEDIDKLICALRDDSKDITFPGYPYGLIEADKYARVSNQEKDFLKTMLLAKAGKDAERLNKIMSTSNAHEILDKM